MTKSPEAFLKYPDRCVGYGSVPVPQQTDSLDAAQIEGLRRANVPGVDASAPVTLKIGTEARAPRLPPRRRSPAARYGRSCGGHVTTTALQHAPNAYGTSAAAMSSLPRSFTIGVMVAMNDRTTSAIRSPNSSPNMPVPNVAATPSRFIT